MTLEMATDPERVTWPELEELLQVCWVRQSYVGTEETMIAMLATRAQERHCQKNGFKTDICGSASPDPLESRNLAERNRKNRSAVPGRETDQGKSQEVGRAWEMAKEGRGGLPRAFAALWVGGRADGHSRKDQRKGVSVMDSLAVLEAQARLVVREGAFPPCVLTRPLVANELIFPSLSCEGIARLETKRAGLMGRS